MRSRARRSRCPPWPTRLARGAGARSPPAPRRGPCHGRRALARRRHDRAGAGRRQNRHRTALDLRPRRQAVRQPSRPPQSSITRAIGEASTRRRISPDMPAFCKPTPMTDTTSSISQAASPARSGRRRAGMHARRPSSPWPTSSRAARAAREEVRSSIAIGVVRGSTRCLRSSGRSTAERLAVRRAISRPQVDDLMAYMREQAKLSRGHDLVKAIKAC